MIQKSPRIGVGLLAFYILTTAVVAYFEFAHSPRAIFELAPSVLRAHPDLVSGMEAACRGDAFASYQSKLTEVIATTPAYASSTKWAYHIGFIAQALMQNAIFVVFLAFVYFDKQTIVRNAIYLKGSVFFLLGYAVFLGSIWCLFRLTYRYEAYKLFGMDNSLIGDYAIVFLYGIVLLVFVVYFELNLQELAKTFSTIGQFLTFVLGVAVLEFKKDQASLVFGTRASVVNVLVLFTLFAFMTALALAFLLKPSSKK